MFRGNIVTFIVSYANEDQCETSEKILPQKQKQQRTQKRSLDPSPAIATTKKTHTNGSKSSKSKPVSVNFKPQPLQTLPRPYSPSLLNLTLSESAGTPDRLESSSEFSSRQHSDSISDKENLQQNQKGVILKELVDAMAKMQDSEDDISDLEDVFLPNGTSNRVFSSTLNSPSNRFKSSAGI